MSFTGTRFTTKDTCVHALRHPHLSSNPGGAMENSPNLLFMDAAEHNRLRTVVREVVAELDPLPEQVLADIGSVVRKLLGRNEIDLVADFARPVAGIVASAVLAVEQELTDSLFETVSATAANLGVWLDGTAPASRAMHQVVRFFIRADARPGGGLDRLRTAAVAGRITEDELLVTPVMLTHAAYENSMNFLAESALRMAESRSLSEQVLDATHRGSIVRELVNEICPTRHVMRRAIAAVDLEGHSIDAGERIAIFLGPPHALAFGTGSHTCPGTRIALAEAGFALAEIAPILGGRWTSTDVVEKDHFVFHGLTRAVIRRG